MCVNLSSVCVFHRSARRVATMTLSMSLVSCQHSR